MEQRPNPQALLKRVQEEERKARRGQLKIYLGAAPGVGKTYTMLRDALEKLSQGLDVVVGVVETHGRREIDLLQKSFEVLPRQSVEYHSHTLYEFDLDAALQRNPGLILIDEMAHTNVPGLRHSKRWQDIREILDRGIDVYTTLNVQHVESLNDVVSQIIHTRIKETVPDSMLEMADTIELVDLPPEDLLKRLQEGKVYFPQQAEIAVENFFRKGNLTALRELALRTTAERVGAQVLLYRQGQGIRHIWPTQDKILVCVGSTGESARLIRAASRFASRLQAEWIAVHIDAPRLKFSEEQRNNAIQNLRLAEQLGAETRLLSGGTDIVSVIMDFAHEQNITQIMVAKRIHSRWRDWIFRNLADELVRHSGEIDVYIVTGEHEEAKFTKPITTQHPIPWRIYTITMGVVILATLINFILFPYLASGNLIMIYLLAVTIVALFGWLGPSILASILSVVAYGFFFLPPYYSFEIEDFQYLFTLIVMLIVTQIISHLTILTRRQAVGAYRSEQRTSSLHSLSRQLAGTRGVDKLLNIAVQYIGEVFTCDVMALLPENNKLMTRARYQTTEELSEKEHGVARWVYDLGQIAGIGTDTLPFSNALYVPMLASQGTIGVLRIHRPRQDEFSLTPEQIHLLEACANQIAIAIEVDRLQEQKKETEFQTETDRLRNVLLQSVSHDLHKPLIAVLGAASTLIEMAEELDTHTIKKLAKEIYFELEELNRLTNNILQITYLETDKIVLQKEFHSMKNLIHFVLKSHKKLGKKTVNMEFIDNLPPVPFDKTLMYEVLINLIDNANKFAPADSSIDISANIKDDFIVVGVKDHGPGIMPDEVNKLFEKFYRGRLITEERGLGLGLAICRIIIKAHKGEIWAENCPEGGAVIYFTLPLRDD